MGRLLTAKLKLFPLVTPSLSLPLPLSLALPMAHDIFTYAAPLRLLGARYGVLASDMHKARIHFAIDAYLHHKP